MAQSVVPEQQGQDRSVVLNITPFSYAKSCRVRSLAVKLSGFACPLFPFPSPSLSLPTANVKLSAHRLTVRHAVVSQSKLVEGVEGRNRGCGGWYGRRDGGENVGDEEGETQYLDQRWVEFLVIGGRSVGLRCRVSRRANTKVGTSYV